MLHHDVDHVVYCEHCLIVEVAEGDKYCNGCVQDMMDELALQHEQSISLAEGWY